MRKRVRLTVAPARGGARPRPLEHLLRGRNTQPDERGAKAILTVEASDRPGLLLALTQTFFRQGLQIVGMRAITTNGRVEDRFELKEADGSSLGAERGLTLQTAVLEALDASLGA